MSNEVVEKQSNPGDGKDVVTWLSLMAAKACPFCSKQHFEINHTITFFRCECGSTFEAVWDEPNLVTKYVWRRGA